jgi:hypothetical protein
LSYSSRIDTLKEEYILGNPCSTFTVLRIAADTYFLDRFHFVYPKPLPELLMIIRNPETGETLSLGRVLIYGRGPGKYDENVVHVH